MSYELGPVVIQAAITSLRKGAVALAAEVGRPVAQAAEAVTLLKGSTFIDA